MNQTTMSDESSSGPSNHLHTTTATATTTQQQQHQQTATITTTAPTAATVADSATTTTAPAAAATTTTTTTTRTTTTTTAHTPSDDDNDNDDDDDYDSRHQSPLSTLSATPAAEGSAAAPHPSSPCTGLYSGDGSGDPDATNSDTDRMSATTLSPTPLNNGVPVGGTPSEPAANSGGGDAGDDDDGGLMRSGCIAHQRRLSSVGGGSSSSGGGGGGGISGSEPDTSDDYAYARACGGGSDANAWARLTEQQLRDLVQEMSRKMEYTEQMNWLCLSSRPKGPPHRKTSLPNHKEVKARFLQICDQTLADEIKAALRLPTFDSYEWSDEAVLHLMQTMFVDCGFVEKFAIPLPVLREWLYEVYKHYNLVPFHNFRHCFCVAQMMYAMAWHTNLMARLGDLEVLILLVSCICHDLDHPGYNNIYQINARTELAIRYNDISPLENHHCSIAFRLLEHPDCNIFQNFDKEAFREIREGIIRCILATDMARHNDILSQFQEVLPHFDYSNQGHINVFCMILIKVADISNESRPMNIAEPWLERLFQEFFAQSAIEKAEGLPVTPFMDPDKVSKPGSQVRFIGLVLLPLFESLGELLPELNELIIHPVRVAFDYYKCLNDAQIRPRKSHCDVDDSSDGAGSAGNSSSLAAAAATAGGTSAGAGNAAAAAGGSGGAGGAGGGGAQLPRSHSGVSLKSRRSMPSQKSMSKNSVDEPMCISAELHDLPEGSESGDSETATEVEVAEKTSKFKINSEGNTGRSSLTCTGLSGLGSSNALSGCGSGTGSGGGLAHIGAGGQPNNKCSRKESRRKRPSMISEMYTSSFGGGKARGSYGNIHHVHIGSGGSGSARCQLFGANRTQSLDHQYNSRRLSDGVPLSGGVVGSGGGVGGSGGAGDVGSDENAICYTHRQHCSLDNDGDKYMSSDSCSVVMMMTTATAAAAAAAAPFGGVSRVQPLGSAGGGGQPRSGGNGAMGSKAGMTAAATSSASAAAAKTGAKNGTSRSFMSTLRQLRESFHITFERDIKKRMTGSGAGAGTGGGAGGSAAVSKNNNPDYIKTADGYCCAAGAQMAAAAAAAAQNEANELPAAAAAGESAAVGHPAVRNRACSLDVPVRMWYGSSNGNGNAGGGGAAAAAAAVDASSRKSSSTTHEDNSNHSNRTLSDPLQIRVGGGSSLDGDGNRSDGTTSI